MSKVTLLVIIPLLFAFLITACNSSEHENQNVARVEPRSESLECKFNDPELNLTDETGALQLDSPLINLASRAHGITRASLLSGVFHFYQIRRYSPENIEKIINSFLLEVQREAAPAVPSKGLKFIADPTCTICAKALEVIQNVRSRCGTSFPPLEIIPFANPGTEGADTVRWLVALRRTQDESLYLEAITESMQLLSGNPSLLAVLREAYPPVKNLSEQEFLVYLESVHPSGGAEVPPEIYINEYLLKKRYGEQEFFDPVASPENFLFALRIITSISQR